MLSGGNFCLTCGKIFGLDEDIVVWPHKQAYRHKCMNICESE